MIRKPSMENHSWSRMSGIDPHEHKLKDIKDKDAVGTGLSEAVEYHGWTLILL